MPRGPDAVEDSASDGPPESFAEDQPMVDYHSLTSPCGLDCFNCVLFLANGDSDLRRSMAERLNIPAERAACAGCRHTGGTVDAIGRTTACPIFACCEEGGHRFCFQCDDFPCDHLHPFADQAAYRPHNTKVYNSCLIKKMGLEKWAKEKAALVKKTYFEGKIDLNR